MQVRRARAVAAGWVHDHQQQLPGFRGAFFSGSLTELSLDSELSATSDVDVVVVLAGSEAIPKLGKFGHEGVLLEVTFLAEDELADVEAVAHTFFLAPSFRTDQVISDPTGHLGRLQRRISTGFSRPEAIRARYQNALERLETRLGRVGAEPAWHDQVSAWLFPTSLTTVVILVAALKNPTVRLRYLNARATLVAHDRLEVYGRLLELTGCAAAQPDQVQRHLDRLAVTFDRAAALARTPFFFSSDITPVARPIAIGGSQDLIAAGRHREAVFWVIATYARCQRILSADAPDVAAQTAPWFAEAVEELLSVSGVADLQRRAGLTLSFLPELSATAETILERAAATPQPPSRRTDE